MFLMKVRVGLLNGRKPIRIGSFRTESLNKPTPGPSGEGSKGKK
jgi:hypothetical protein